MEWEKPKKAVISNTSFSNKELYFTELETKNQKHNILHKSYYKSIYNFGKRCLWKFFPKGIVSYKEE